MGLSSQRARQRDTVGVGDYHSNQQTGLRTMVGNWMDESGRKINPGTMGESSAAVAVEATGAQSKLTMRSNRLLIQNAIRHVCLAGDVNKELNEQVLQVRLA